MIRTIFWIGTGSFVGGVARYFISKVIQTNTDSFFPMGTFIVNVLGCLLIGILYGVLQRTNVANKDFELFLIVGLCGGFTTFSSFMNDNMTLLNQNYFFHFLLYAGSSFVLGLLAVYFGQAIVRMI